MTTSTGTDSDPQGEGSKQDVVPPADESHGDGGKPPGDWMKKSQFIAALNDVTRKNDALQAELDALKAAQEKKAEERPTTHQELRRLVEAGQLTQEQADTLWKNQVVQQATQEAVAGVTEVIGARERTTKVNAVLSGYQEVVPEAWVDGAPERAKVAKAFQELTELGFPPTKETEAAALRAAFGDLEALRASKSARPGTSETQTEVGGAKSSDGGAKGGGLKDLTAREKAHYERLIGQGIYKGWDEVKAEREFARSRSRAR